MARAQRVSRRAVQGESYRLAARSRVAEVGHLLAENQCQAAFERAAIAIEAAGVADCYGRYGTRFKSMTPRARRAMEQVVTRCYIRGARP